MEKQLWSYLKHELKDMGYNKKEIEDIIAQRPGDMDLILGFMDDLFE